MFDDLTVDRLWDKVEKGHPNECWEWKGYKLAKGYGSLSIKNKPIMTHRLAWQIHHQKPIPFGLCVRHKCDNPPCCNPDHLEIGTVADNNRDMWDRNRQRGSAADAALKTHCLNGHPLSGKNLLIRRNGTRCCRSCMLARGQAHRQRKRAKRDG